MTSAKVLLSTLLALAGIGNTGACKEPSSKQTNAAASSAVPLLGVPSVLPLEPEIPARISVLEAVASTERYVGRRVLVAGVFSKELGGVFATSEHARLNLPEYAVALGQDACELPKPAPWNFFDLDLLDGEYVRVEARLSTKVRGQHGIFKVGLCDVTRITKAGFVSNEPVAAGGKSGAR